MDQLDLCRPVPRKPVLVNDINDNDPVRTAAVALLQTLEQVRKQLERRVDWCELEPRLTKLVQRAEASLQQRSEEGAQAASYSGALLATLTEVSVSAAVAAEAGQWRWAWSTDGVRAKLLRMRRDLKRAFAAAGPATPAIHSVEVAESPMLEPSTPPQTSPRRLRLWEQDGPEPSAAPPALSAVRDASCQAEGNAAAALVTSSSPQGTVTELAAGLRLRPIRTGRVCLEP